MALLLVAMTPSLAHGQIFNFNGINQDILDGNLAGIADSHSINLSTAPIQSVQVTLNIVGTGDGAVNDIQCSAPV